MTLDIFVVGGAPFLGAMVAFTDSDGTPLSAGGNYRVNLPANIPAANFWSLTPYECERPFMAQSGRATHADECLLRVEERT
jgi:hypothetical protein